MVALRLLDGGADELSMEGRVPYPELVSAHLAAIAWTHRPGSVQARRRALARWQRWATAHQVDPLHPDHRDLFRYLDRPLSDGARAHEIGHLSCFYRWCIAEEHLDLDPTVRLPRPTQRLGVPRPIPEAVLGRALAEASERVRPWLYLAAFAGLRACEIAPLRAEHLWWHTDPHLILIAEGKGGRSATVPMAPILEPVLRSLPAVGFLFQRHDGGPGPLNAWNVSHGANRHLRRYGPWTLHTLRHRFGTQAHRVSGDLRKTQTLMRHRSIVSTTIYTAVELSESARIVSALPAIVA